MATTNLTPSGVVFADSTVQPGNPLYMKNRIINGNFAIDQLYQHAYTYITNTYSTASMFRLMDRWIFNSTGNVTFSGGVNKTTTTYQGKTTNCITIGSAGQGNGVLNYSGVAQRIESIYTQDLVNKPVSLQVGLQASAATTVYWTVYYPTTKDSYSTPDPSNGLPVYYNCTQIATGSWSVGTSMSTYSANFNAGSFAGNGLLVYVYTGTGAGGFGLTMTGFQLEKGPSIPFQATTAVFNPGTLENRSIQEEYKLCQRYQYIDNFSGLNTQTYYVNNTSYPYRQLSVAEGFWITGSGYTNFHLKWNFKVPMYSKGTTPTWVFNVSSDTTVTQPSGIVNSSSSKIQLGWTGYGSNITFNTNTVLVGAVGRNAYGEIVSATAYSPTEYSRYGPTYAMTTSILSYVLFTATGRGPYYNCFGFLSEL